MLLKRKMPRREPLFEVDVLIQLLAVDRHLDLGDFAIAPFALADFDFVIEPGVGFDQLFVDMAEPIERTGADGVAMGAVDLCFVAIEKAGLARGAEIHPGVAAVADFDFRAVFEILEWACGANEHRGIARTTNRAVDNFPFARLAADPLPAFERLAIKQGLPFLGLKLGPAQQAITDHQDRNCEQKQLLKHFVQSLSEKQPLLLSNF